MQDKINQLILMSQSHLANVQNTINDLESKKLEIDQEVNRLKEYLKNGIELLQQFNTSSSVDNVVSKNVSKPYLGE
jgi:signal transduction histidine kinase